MRDTEADRRAREHIHTSIKRVYSSIADVQDLLSRDGSVPERAVADLQGDICTLITILRPYRDRSAIDWEAATPVEGGPDAILWAVLEGEVVEQAPPGEREGEPRPQRVPKRFDVETLLLSAYDLLDIAQRLGFVADPAPDARPAEFGTDDLEADPEQLRPPEFRR